MSVGEHRTPVRPRLAMREISKTFPGTKALDSVSLDVFPGEIHSLVGGNGSGKSTLIKILMGVHHADAGGFFDIDGNVTAADTSSPEFARAAGVQAVHQDLGVFPELNVAENLAIGYGYETGFLGKVQWTKLQQRAQRLIERFEIPAQPDTPLASLSQGARTQVAIARALQGDDAGTGILILDEPTAALPAHEVDLLIANLRRYAAHGQAILYVSHRLDEVLSLSDRVTVLRDGKKVGTYAAADLDERRLIELIVGRTVEQAAPTMPPVINGAPMLRVDALTAGQHLVDVSFEVGRGEVVGIAGLLGSGRTELLRTLFGDLDCKGGTMTLDGRSHAPRRTLDAMKAGVSYVPENRARDAAFTDLRLFENLSMANIAHYWSGGRMRRSRMRADGQTLLKKYLVKARDVDSLLSSLSGGNQQKVIVARWLRHQPVLMLLDEPTQGVDVGARAEIYQLVRDAVVAGASALIVASDAEELAHVCDRVLILDKGRIAGELKPPELDAERLIQRIYQTAGEM